MSKIEHWKNLSLQDIEDEVWKDIEDFEWYYQVSNMGRVKSVQRKVYINRGKGYYRSICERILKQWKKETKKKNSTIMFNISYEATKYSFNSARLVYKYFGKNKNMKKKLILHKDLNSDNNYIENLYLGNFEDLSNIISNKSNGKNKYKGVSFIGERNRKKRIRMGITIKRKYIWENCKTELEAAKRYDHYIKKYDLKRKGNFINND